MDVAAVRILLSQGNQSFD